MRDLGLVAFDEPFANLLTQGMVLNEIFFRKTASGRLQYFNPTEVDIQHDADGKRMEAVLRADGQPVESAGIGTMSKSKNNGIDPQEIIEQYGADTARLFMMFASPPTQTLEWSDAGVEGAYRFLKRLWRLVYQHKQQGEGKLAAADMVVSQEYSAELRDLRYQLHQTIAKVTDDLERRHTFNTAIAAVMELMNKLANVQEATPAAYQLAQKVLENSVLLLSPIVPHICHVLWSELRPGTMLLEQPWPQVDEQALIQDEIEMVVQVNGKLRGQIRVAKEADRATIEQLALAHKLVQKNIAERPIRKIIVVPERLVNIVV